jgi:hypothetical protein
VKISAASAVQLKLTFAERRKVKRRVAFHSANFVATKFITQSNKQKQKQRRLSADFKISD